MRVLVLLLIVANAAYFAWSQGLLKSAGLAPAEQSEPQRLAQQIKPDSVRLLSAAEFKRVEELARAEQAPRECLQAGPLSDAQTTALRALLDKTLPEGSWALQETHVPARWMVYMGKFANEQSMAKKRSELAALNVRSEPVSVAVLQPGLSLGLYEVKERASEELARLEPRGIRTARVVQERAEGNAYLLRLPAVTEALKPRLTEVRSVLSPLSLKACE